MMQARLEGNIRSHLEIAAVQFKLVLPREL